MGASLSLSTLKNCHCLVRRDYTTLVFLVGQVLQRMCRAIGHDVFLELDCGGDVRTRAKTS